VEAQTNVRLTSFGKGPGLSLSLKCCFGGVVGVGVVVVIIDIVMLSVVILLSPTPVLLGPSGVTRVLGAWHPPSPGLPGINGKLFRWGSHPSGDVFKKKTSRAPGRFAISVIRAMEVGVKLSLNSLIARRKKKKLTDCCACSWLIAGKTSHSGYFKRTLKL
jgi:hypothetical protein